jgi:DNA-binding protein YbaB
MSTDDAGRHWGSALDGAVEVAVDDRGRVSTVELQPDVLRRLWPEQLGSAVVAAHAEALRAVGAVGAANGGDQR